MAARLTWTSLSALGLAGLLVLGDPFTTTPLLALALAWAYRRPAARAVAPRIASERGSMLVEVMVGTLLLGIATAAVLEGIDGAQRTGMHNKNRSVAATLAQQDIERMRSMPPTALSGYEAVRTATVGGVPYTVSSQADWVVDAIGLLSCTTDENEAEYLELTSTVSAPSSTEAPSTINTPVTATSLLTPSPEAFADDAGTATVSLTDRDGEPLEGVTVKLTGPGSESTATNEAGCAIFPFIEAGTWTVEVSGGWVSWSGETPVEIPIIVAERKKSLAQIQLDEPASVRASFESPAGNPITWPSGLVGAKEISLANGNLPGGVRSFPAGAFAYTEADGLFPFLDGYGVFFGTCEASNPTVWDGDYYQTSPGSISHAVPDPGGSLTVDVIVPTLQLTVQRASSATFRRVRVTVDQRDTAYDCSAEIYDSSTVSVPANTTSYALDVPLPFGRYRICTSVNPNASGSSGWRSFTSGTSTTPADQSLTAPADKPVTTTIAASGSSNGAGSGECS